MNAVGQRALLVSFLLTCVTSRPDVTGQVVAGSEAARSMREESADSAARIDWLRRHAVTIRSIDPKDEDYSDLAAVGAAIGDARVVFLGDPSHGTGNLFSAQSRIVKYLHQERGFDVLVFESGLYDVSKVWQSILAGEPPAASFRTGVFGLWSLVEEFGPLMEYVGARAHSARPLEVAGFDEQYSGSASFDHLVPDLRAFLDSLGLAPVFAADSVLWRGFRRIHHEEADSIGRDSTGLAPFQARLAHLREAVRSREGAARGFWSQVLESVAVYARQVWLDTADPNGEDSYPAFNFREAQNARNLLWLADHQYRGRKLIVWAATVHAARNVGGIDPRAASASVDYARTYPTGGAVWDVIGPQMYTLGFVALEGESRMAADTWPITADQEPEMELEEMLAAASFDMAFLNYRTIAAGGEWLRGPLLSRPFGNTAMLAPSWPDVMDGLLFVRVGTPATWPVRK